MSQRTTGRLGRPASIGGQWSRRNWRGRRGPATLQPHRSSLCTTWQRRTRALLTPLLTPVFYLSLSSSLNFVYDIQLPSMCQIDTTERELFETKVISYWSHECCRAQLLEHTSYLSRDMVLCFHILYFIIKDNPIQVSVCLIFNCFTSSLVAPSIKSQLYLLRHKLATLYFPRFVIYSFFVTDQM